MFLVYNKNMAYIDKTFFFDQGDREIKIQNPNQLSDWDTLSLRWRWRNDWDSYNTKNIDFYDEKLISIELWPYNPEELEYSKIVDKEKEIMLTISQALKLSQKLQMAVNEIITEYQINQFSECRHIETLESLHAVKIRNFEDKINQIEKEFKESIK